MEVAPAAAVEESFLKEGFADEIRCLFINWRLRMNIVDTSMFYMSAEFLFLNRLVVPFRR